MALAISHRIVYHYINKPIAFGVHNMTDFFTTLMPIPRVLSAGEGSVPFAGRVALSLEGLSTAQETDFSKLTGMVFGEQLAAAGLPLTVRLDPTHAPVEVANEKDTLRAEAYEVVVAEGQITLTAAQFAGLQRGIQTVKQLLENADDTGNPVPGCRIVDWPRLAHRGIHYDFARSMEYRHEHIKSVIAKLAYFKMNTFHLYLEGLFAFPSAPEIAQPCPLTPELAKDLREYARIFGITLVPQISTMGHMENLLNGP